MTDMSERARALEQALRALAYDIGTVRDVAARRGDPDVDHRLMLVRLDHWRSVILNAIAPLEAVEPPPSGASPQAETCRVCGGYGFVAQKQTIDDGWGEVDTCPACTDQPAPVSPVEPTPEPPQDGGNPK